MSELETTKSLVRMNAVELGDVPRIGGAVEMDSGAREQRGGHRRYYAGGGEGIAKNF